MSINEVTKGGRDYVGYEYKMVAADNGRASMYLDGYRSFGWEPDETVQSRQIGSVVTLKLRRDRKILNKMELTRLQHHFEACMDEIAVLERSKTQTATIIALAVGMIGTALMAGSTFAVIHEPPMVWLCVLLAIPAFIGWALPYFLFKSFVKKRSDQVELLIEQKYDEIYNVCEKGNRLL